MSFTLLTHLHVWMLMSLVPLPAISPLLPSPHTHISFLSSFFSPFLLLRLTNMRRNNRMFRRKALRSLDPNASVALHRLDVCITVAGDLASSHCNTISTLPFVSDKSNGTIHVNLPFDLLYLRSQLSSLPCFLLRTPRAERRSLNLRLH